MKGACPEPPSGVKDLPSIPDEALCTEKHRGDRRSRPCRSGPVSTSHESPVTSGSSLPRYFITSLLPHFTQEALPMRNHSVEILSNRLPHIRQSVPHSQVHARAASRRI